MASIFATTEEVQRKAGANASAVSNVASFIDEYMAQAESIINAKIRFNFSDNYATLNVDVKGLLKQAAASWAAVEVIRYDMTGFFSRQEALTMINSLLHQWNTCINLIKDMNVKTFMVDA